MSGQNAPNSIQRAYNSGVVVPVKPPMSVLCQPTPESPMPSSMGTCTARSANVFCTSPDQLMAPVRCMPAEPERVSMNTRWPGRSARWRS